MTITVPVALTVTVTDHDHDSMTMTINVWPCPSGVVNTNGVPLRLARGGAKEVAGAGIRRHVSP